jgi:hypothetical protein
VAVVTRPSHGVAIPLEASAPTVERLAHLRRLTCLGRAFVVIAGEDVFVHFELPGDAAHFADLFDSFYGAAAPAPAPAAESRHDGSRHGAT